MSGAAVVGPDYGARDGTIRHLTYTPLRRREGVSDALFDAYWRDVHGPLCARLPGLGFYVQHHLDRDAGANLWPLPDGVRPIDTVLDGMVEIGFADADGQAQFQEASPLLFADERNFLGHDVAYVVPEGARTLVDRDPDGVPNRAETGHRIHVHFQGAGPLFEQAMTALAESVAASDGVVKVRLHLAEAYHNSAPSPEAPEVDHVLPAVRKRVAMLEIGWRDRLSAEDYFAGEDYAARSVELAAHVGAIGAWRVRGVYVFIRDGVLTTAGLRGSRPAVLIDQLGARNQVQDEVTRLFDGR